ncbi:MAG: Oxidoreductase, short chain dehydrogenase/reductase family protein [Microgenomates group bacterium GW2011_GWC1_41_8]|nr:MAG: Oxidoreductase, short chain dehydrogenase/reductase family protein [Microgenomates group bacterium GW2011_GWC1_41_8]
MSYLDEIFGIKDRVALITGGNGHLGSEYAEAFAKAGAKVAVFDVTEKPSTKVQKLIDSGLPIISLKVDVTKKGEIAAGFEKIISKFGAPTILVNNAGLGSRPNAPPEENGPFENYPEESWDAMLDSHLKGMFFMSQVFIKNFRAAKEKKGSIINISSTYGLVSPIQSMYEFRRRGGEEYYKPVGYSVAKSGVLNFTKWLAEYAAPLGIRVNTLAPGGVYEANMAPEFVKEYENRTMLRRMAKTTDYNGAVLFLASEASDYMTGSLLVVDGGWTPI